MSGQMSAQDLNRITASAEHILKLHHGAMNSFDLVLELMKSCMKGVRPDVAASIVEHALEEAVRSKHLVLRGNEYFLPPPPKPPVAFVPHSVKVAAQQQTTRTSTRTRQAAIKPTPAPVVNQPFTVPSGPMTVKTPPKPAPPPPPEPAPWRTDEYVTEPTFTQHPSQVGPMRQESLFDLTPRQKPARKLRSIVSPEVDGHEMRQAGFALPVSAALSTSKPNRDDDSPTT